jgi:hypothetical protein
VCRFIICSRHQTLITLRRRRLTGHVAHSKGKSNTSGVLLEGVHLKIQNEVGYNIKMNLKETG